MACCGGIGVGAACSRGSEVQCIGFAYGNGGVEIGRADRHRRLQRRPGACACQHFDRQHLWGGFDVMQIEQGGDVAFDDVVAAIRRSGSLEYARRMALEEAELAREAARVILGRAQPGPFGEVLMGLPGLAVERAR